MANTRNQENEKVIGTDNVADLAPAWVFSVDEAGGGGTIESTPMVADGCVYVGTQSGWVFAMNADNGKLVWKKELPATVTTLSVAKGQVFADVSRADAPLMIALDQHTGEISWKTTLTRMKGSDVTGSPVAFGDMVATGTSCIGAELSSGEDRLKCRGSFVILDQASGEVLAVGYGIPDRDFKRDYAGGSMWSAPAIDMDTGHAYEGAGNPFSAKEHSRTNALLKIDVDPSRRTFGNVVDSYKATGEQYFPPLGTYKPACDASGHNVGVCELPDLDMAMAPNIFFDSTGQKMVGDGQSSGIYHTVTADTMEYVWTKLTGPPFAGARSGGSAYDGKRIYAAGGTPGQLWALDKDTGFEEWVTPSMGLNMFNNVAYANGVVYTPSGGAFVGPIGGAMVLAYEAKTGNLLLARPMTPDIGDVAIPVQAGGVSIARNTIYVPVNGGTGGYIVAYQTPK
ncbi:MAG: PQQ-binding-like beta-propeller repeat protein [Actinomycetota bacterium]|nr:PQQ-binding-like beta-propeller repeat protein [Actinomycetota bacterium]